ncbi:PREDICTED: brain-enriched guanylate kinase-associated protein [Miniopterus natalensis]|uniref:brain-enriched guanylate kinase-associated protein n=1 Tax=Miniopterus natalensis TaxID=291302 RepID=UPI0007A6BCF6|nr:PREDICTED: brain-enriched guanylate kinase-associated protein [Miniopterus natalensis]
MFSAAPGDIRLGRGQWVGSRALVQPGPTQQAAWPWGSWEGQTWLGSGPIASCSRIQTNYMTLQRINQELEEKLQRMGQHYEEEKRALSHEIVALNSHLLEAKVTIDKLSEDNELYRKDCNLAAQLLQCSQNYGRVHKVSEVAPGFARTLSPYQADSYGFPGSPGVHRTLMTPPNLWSLRAKPGSARMPRQDLRGPWRPVEEIGAYSFPVPGRRPSPRRFPDRYYGGSSPGHRSEGRDSPFYASYKADSFSEGDDFSQGHLAEPPFLRARGPAYPMPGYASSEGDGERLPGQLCGVASPEPEQSLQSSRDSLEPSSMEGSPEMHPEARLSPQPTFPRGGGAGLNRKDSLTKAQLYGTLLN